MRNPFIFTSEHNNFSERLNIQQHPTLNKTCDTRTESYKFSYNHYHLKDNIEQNNRNGHTIEPMKVN